VTSELKDDTSRLLERLHILKNKLNTSTITNNPSSTALINAVATSNDISKELKEILILLHTTTTTENLADRVSAFKINLELTETSEEIIALQNKLINRLVITPLVQPKKTLVFDILKLYKAPITAVGMFITLWGLAMIDHDTMFELLKKIPELFKRIL